MELVLGVSKWTKHPNAPGNENDLREPYMFPNKPSFLVYRLVIVAAFKLCKLEVAGSES